MHHAYYIEGPLSLFEAYKEALAPYYARQYERFGIDEARELQGVASLKNYESGTFLLATGALTSEAQQALLKLFEEPQQGTMFVVMLPHGMLLPTLRSRMMEWPTEQQIVMKNSLARDGSEPRRETRGLFSGQSAVQFLKASGKDRTDFITKLLKEEDKEQVRDFLSALEAELYVRLTKSNSGQMRQGLGDIAMVRDYLRDRSPSLKMLLEHLALSLPVL